MAFILWYRSGKVILEANMAAITLSLKAFIETFFGEWRGEIWKKLNLKKRAWGNDWFPLQLTSVMGKGISAVDHLKADAFSSVAPKCHPPSAKVLFTIYIEPAPVMLRSGGYRSTNAERWYMLVQTNSLQIHTPICLTVLCLLIKGRYLVLSLQRYLVNAEEVKSSGGKCFWH